MKETKAKQFTPSKLDVMTTGDIAGLLAGCCDEHKHINANHIIAGRALTAHSGNPGKPHVRFGLLLLVNKESIEGLSSDNENDDPRLNLPLGVCALIVEEAIRMLSMAIPGDHVVRYLVDRVLQEMHNAATEGAFTEESFFSTTVTDPEIEALLADAAKDVQN